MKSNHVRYSAEFIDLNSLPENIEIISMPIRFIFLIMAITDDLTNKMFYYQHFLITSRLLTHLNSVVLFDIA